MSEDGEFTPPGAYLPRFRLRGAHALDVVPGLTQDEIRQGKPMPDFETLFEQWVPPDPNDVMVHLILFLGWDDDAGSDDFHTTIWTQAAVDRVNRERKRKRERPLNTRRCIIVHQYDWLKIKIGILNVIAKCERATYQESAAELNKHFAWEYGKHQ